MHKLRSVGGLCAVSLLGLWAGGVCGQDLSARPIRILTSGLGGSGDFMARLIAQGLTAGVGWQVIVDNRGAPIAIETVAKAAPDGHTLLVSGSALTIGALMQNMPYDPLTDFSPVTLIARSPNILVVHPSLPVKSVKELIALAKSKPGALNYASSGTGSITHLAAELFKSMAGVDIVRINYKGSGIALNDLIGGHVQVMFPTASSTMPYVKSGRLRALAVTSDQRSALFPELQTVAAAGLPGYESTTMTSIYAPAKTPAAVVQSLGREIVRVISRPDSKERLLNAGADVVGSSPEELASAMKSEMVRLGKVIKSAGIRAD